MPLAAFARQSRPGVEVAGYSGERLVNYFARPSDGVSPIALIARAGLKEYATTPREVRAIVSRGSDLYAVSNGIVFKITEGAATEVGRVPIGPTRMASSRSEVAIVVNGQYFICDGTGTQEYSTGAVTFAVDVESMDGYFIVAGHAAGREDAITISGLDDGTTFNALEFSFAEESPDRLTAILRDHNRLWLFGTETVQPFFNSGNADFPFEPVQGALIEHGCVSGATVASADNTVFWVRPDGAVMRSGGSDPQIISTPEVKSVLAGSDVTSAFAYSEGGHEFYTVSRQSGTSLTYDMTTGMWHERSSGLNYGTWLPTVATTIDGIPYFGCSDGRIACSQERQYHDFSEPLMSEAVSMPMQEGADRFRVRRVHANFVGGKNDIGRDPDVMLQVGEDGLNWGVERWRPLAGLGGHYKRAAWHSLGMFRRVQFRIRVTDAVPRDLIGVDVDLA